jgi:hypothetical protein
MQFTASIMQPSTQLRISLPDVIHSDNVSISKNRGRASRRVLRCMTLNYVIERIDHQMQSTALDMHRIVPDKKKGVIKLLHDACPAP